MLHQGILAKEVDKDLDSTMKFYAKVKIYYPVIHEKQSKPLIVITF